MGFFFVFIRQILIPGLKRFYRSKAPP
jgi:hypothetical protein